MRNTYIEFYYHLVWSTKDREPYISPEIEGRLYGYIRTRCEDLGVFVYALNGTENHTHLVCSIPPRLAISEVMEKLKGASSHFINHLGDTRLRLYWQPGYGGLTFAKKDLKRIVDYVESQKMHHRQGSVHSSMERMTESQS